MPQTPDFVALESRLQRLEDIEAIQRLFVDYGIALDGGDFDAYAALFARHGMIDLGPLGSATGPVEIKALMERTLAGIVGSSFHLITSPVITLDGDRATSVVMWSAISRGDDGAPHLAMLGKHRDRLVREDGEWRFAHRKGYIDLPNTYPAS